MMDHFCVINMYIWLRRTGNKWGIYEHICGLGRSWDIINPTNNCIIPLYLRGTGMTYIPFTRNMSKRVNNIKWLNVNICAYKPVCLDLVSIFATFYNVSYIAVCLCYGNTVCLWLVIIGRSNRLVTGVKKCDCNPISITTVTYCERNPPRRNVNAEIDTRTCVIMWIILYIYIYIFSSLFWMLLYK